MFSARYAHIYVYSHYGIIRIYAYRHISHINFIYILSSLLCRVFHVSVCIDVECEWSCSSLRFKWLCPRMAKQLPLPPHKSDPRPACIFCLDFHASMHCDSNRSRQAIYFWFAPNCRSWRSTYWSVLFQALDIHRYGRNKLAGGRYHTPLVLKFCLSFTLK